jgi:DNA-binding CsgD family transcriptional regulator
VEDAGDVTVLNSYQWRLVHLQFLDGNWDDAIAEGEAALAISRETGLRGIFVHGLALLAEITLHRNDLERAAAYLTINEGGSGEGYRTRARGLLCEAQSDPVGALEALDQAWTQFAHAGFVVAYTEVGPDLVRLLVAAGDRARARHIVREIEMSADRQQTASARGAALRSRGLADDDPQVLLEAARVMNESPRLLARANTLRDAGLALSRTLDQDQGIALLEEALSVFEALGAEYDVRSVEASLRSAGVARGRRGRRARPATGWGALTKTELDVAALITRGLTARETGQRLFISPRTVETHVAHIFAKLGLSSRSELRVAYERWTGAAAITSTADPPPNP